MCSTAVVWRCCVVGQWKSAGKDWTISGFSDPIISNGRVIIDLIDAIKPGSVKYDVVKAGLNDEVGGPMVSILTLIGSYITFTQTSSAA